MITVNGYPKIEDCILNYNFQCHVAILGRQLSFTLLKNRKKQYGLYVLDGTCCGRLGKCLTLPE